MRLVCTALRYFKCYEATEIVPLFCNDESYVGLIGENGVGKSAVLEALNCFFTEQGWIRNKTGKKGKAECGVAVIVYCEEDEIPKKTFTDEELRQLKSNSKLVKKVVGKHITANTKGLYLACMSFQNDKVRLFDGAQVVSDSDELGQKLKEFLLKSFKYIYIGAEVDINHNTDINSETAEFIKGSGAVGEITKILQDVKIELRDKSVVTIANLINSKVVDYLENDIIKKLQDVDPNYNYKNLKTGAQSKLSEKHLSELAAQALFNNRELTKKIKTKDIGISDMSSGQRRKALLDFIIVMIGNLDQKEREKIILAIDEPEISVDASSRIQQFDKLKALSLQGSNILFTTHWYGWIAQILGGNAVLIKETDAGRTLIASSITNFLDKEVQDKVPYEMRMMFDFLSSLGTWAESSPETRFVLCEGRTDYNYISKQYADHKTIPLRGREEVVRLYKIFSDYYFRAKKKPSNIIFLIDTDPEKAAELKGSLGENLRRISRDRSGKIKIVTNEDNYSEKCAIEDLLSPEPFLKALNEAAKKLSDDDKAFIKGLSVKYSDETGVRALGLDDKQKQKLKEIYKVDGFKMNISELYEPVPADIKTFKKLLNLA